MLTQSLTRLSAFEIERQMEMDEDVPVDRIGRLVQADPSSKVRSTRFWLLRMLAHCGLRVQEVLAEVGELISAHPGFSNLLLQAAVRRGPEYTQRWASWLVCGLKVPAFCRLGLHSRRFTFRSGGPQDFALLSVDMETQRPQSVCGRRFHSGT